MIRRLSVLILGLSLALGAFASPAAAFQAQKEVTDGFFDIPPRDPSQEAVPWGLPAYLVTSTLGAGAVFILCKSARRS